MQAIDGFTLVVVGIFRIQLCSNVIPVKWRWPQLIALALIRLNQLGYLLLLAKVLGLSRSSL